jgi:4-hydroxybenzoate polyprenyltransferase
VTVPGANTPPAPAGALGTARLLLQTARPRHWIKNGFVVAPLFFSGLAGEPDKALAATATFALFCAMSSAIYLGNDIADRERDRTHPEKRLRPIASGALSVPAALATSAVLVVSSLAAAALLPFGVLAALVAYGLLNAAYNARLKHLVIVDVFCVAGGFVLRVLAGGAAIGITPTAWLVVATFLLSLLLALAKRRHELVLLEGDSTGHRPVLLEYTPAFVDELISVATPVTLITYLLYTLDAETIARFHTRYLYPTGLFVVFGIFRYLYLVHRKDGGGDPVELALKDAPLALTVVGWIAAFAVIVYWRP